MRKIGYRAERRNALRKLGRGWTKVWRNTTLKRTAITKYNTSLVKIIL